MIALLLLAATMHRVLDHDITFAGATIPARTTVFYAADGKIEKMFLSRDTVIQGHLCRGGADAWETAFYPSGHLRLCWLAKDETIDRIPCRRATFWADVTGSRVGVWLHEDGHLARCEAARAFTLGTCRGRKGAGVVVDGEGKVTVAGVACTQRRE